MIRVGVDRSTIKNGSFVDVRQYGSGIENVRSVIDVGAGGIADARVR